jgi:threonyl-tRNA synthetase
MEEITKADYPFIRREISFLEALRFFEAQGEDYKLELIRDLGVEKVSLYTQGSFTDLCRGPHVPSTGKIKAFYLTKVAGAYWRGDERRAMLAVFMVRLLRIRSPDSPAKSEARRGS